MFFQAPSALADARDEEWLIEAETAAETALVTHGVGGDGWAGAATDRDDVHAVAAAHLARCSGEGAPVAMHVALQDCVKGEIVFETGVESCTFVKVLDTFDHRVELTAPGRTAIPERGIVRVTGVYEDGHHQEFATDYELGPLVATDDGVWELSYFPRRLSSAPSNVYGFCLQVERRGNSLLLGQELHAFFPAHPLGPGRSLDLNPHFFSVGRV